MRVVAEVEATAALEEAAFLEGALAVFAGDGMLEEW